MRQVELAGQDQRPIAAAAVAEWIDAFEAGGAEAYEARFGQVAEAPIGDREPPAHPDDERSTDGTRRPQ